MSAGPIIGVLAVAIAALYLWARREDRDEAVSSEWVRQQIRRDGRK